MTTAGYNVAADGYDALLWNEGDGTFTEGARRAGLTAAGWHAGAAVGDVNADGLPDLFVAGYTDPNVTVPSASGFPTNHLAVRDLLYLNEGEDESGRAHFREVAEKAGIEKKRVGHGLGAVLFDYDLDGRLDLYVANDADPNQLYRNAPRSGGLGFRLVEVAKPEAVDDPNAGMGIAAADYSLDGRTDLFVTNSRGQLHASYRSRPNGAVRPAFVDARPELAAVLGTQSTGWGTSWADLDLDGDLDLVVANGAIPVTSLARDAQRVRVLENVARRGATRFVPADAAAGLARTPRVNGRGLATADYDNDGDVDVAINSIGGRLQLLRNEGGTRRPLARGRAAHVRSRHRRHCRATRRAPARPRAAGGQQLPLVRGSPPALRARQGLARRAAAGPVSGRHDDTPPERGGRPDRRCRQAREVASPTALSGRSAPATGGRRCRA